MAIASGSPAAAAARIEAAPGAPIALAIRLHSASSAPSDASVVGLAGSGAGSAGKGSVGTKVGGGFGTKVPPAALAALRALIRASKGTRHAGRFFRAPLRLLGALAGILGARMGGDLGLRGTFVAGVAGVT